MYIYIYIAFEGAAPVCKRHRTSCLARLILAILEAKAFHWQWPIAVLSLNNFKIHHIHILIVFYFKSRRLVHGLGYLTSCWAWPLRKDDTRLKRVCGHYFRVYAGIYITHYSLCQDVLCPVDHPTALHRMPLRLRKGRARLLWPP